ncbi:hypothetical protein S14_54 [Shewanella sp. phage 1/4]|uniref:hypothetical protein n=1 Tax=Shewanella phage 1/4 TaxID=1458859 RepID=UPI0004F61C22|nr:hypothetical protein S14_54 [Shewanella sp. phage 1/4]AHK11166.1 hypothetical protein S14_54 [Shewanella sp. phage 1/4]
MMSKQFTMSMFTKKEDLYKAKAEYWEAIARDSVKYGLFQACGRDTTEQEIEDCITMIESELGL